MSAVECAEFLRKLDKRFSGRVADLLDGTQFAKAANAENFGLYIVRRAMPIGEAESLMVRDVLA